MPTADVDATNLPVLRDVDGTPHSFPKLGSTGHGG